MSTKLTTGKVRFSYVTIFVPKATNQGEEPKYSVALLIPKSDTATVAKIRAAIAEAREVFCQKNGAAALPAKPVDPLHDGDDVKPNSGEPYGPECKGCWVMNASSKQKPLILDSFKNEITDPGEVYSGCYGRAVINFYGYNNRRKGIGAGLLGIMKLHDGDPLGGNMASVDDFDDGFTDDDDFSM